jgi:hypothetical protein
MFPQVTHIAMYGHRGNVHGVRVRLSIDPVIALYAGTSFGEIVAVTSFPPLCRVRGGVLG